MDELGDVRWMTYAEVGQILGIERASAKRLAARKRWARTRGNDGMARIGVPLDHLEKIAANDETGEDTPELALLRQQLARREGETGGLREALRIAEAQLAETRDRLAQALALAEAATRRAAEAEREAGEVGGLKQSLGVLRQVLEHARESSAAAERRATEAQAEADAANRRSAVLEGQAEEAERRIAAADAQAAEAGRRAEEARRRATEAEARAAMADRATLDARQGLARLRERGLLARLLNRQG